MGDIKVENADPTTSHPLVLDVMSADTAVTEPIATHVLTFGDFVIVQALDNLVIVSAEDWAQRQADATAEATPKAGPGPVPGTLMAHEAEPKSGKYKRAELEAMTKAELEDVADDHDIDVNSHMTKDEMVDAILKGQ